jgi:hypothetical protein
VRVLSSPRPSFLRLSTRHFHSLPRRPERAGWGWRERRDKVGEEAANPAIGHETFLNLASLFIDRCAPKQLRVNPDKCAAPSLSLLAPPPLPSSRVPTR